MPGIISESYQGPTDQNPTLDLFVDTILDVARENAIDDATIIIRDLIVKDITKPLVVALLRAKTTLRQWNGMGLSGEAEQACWDAYQHSPEMKEINAAIELVKGPQQCGALQPNILGVPEAEDRCVRPNGHEGKHSRGERRAHSRLD